MSDTSIDIPEVETVPEETPEVVPDQAVEVEEAPEADETWTPDGNTSGQMTALEAQGMWITANVQKKLNTSNLRITVDGVEYDHVHVDYKGVTFWNATNSKTYSAADKVTASLG